MSETGDNQRFREGSDLVEHCPWWQLVREQVTSLQFGTVQIVVHQGRVTQVERSEKVRLNSSEPPTPANVPSRSSTSKGRE